jgi:carotenoid cleavage dioxygenase-like enzyme
MIFHVANAWQESKDIVKLYACCFEDVSQLLWLHETADSARQLNIPIQALPSVCAALTFAAGKLYSLHACKSFLKGPVCCFQLYSMNI